MATCGKCGGSGVIQAFTHYAEGRCFGCHGTGRVRDGSLCAEPPRRSQAEIDTQEVRGIGERLALAGWKRDAAIQEIKARDGYRYGDRNRESFLETALRGYDAVA